jgi:Protein-L-isoaspartate carboxylmethyltransferase
MVEQQLKPRGIKDERVLAAMAKVPREEFIPRMREPTRTKMGRCPSVTIRPFPSHTSWRL